jgi:hypothetical protein
LTANLKFFPVFWVHRKPFNFFTPRPRPAHHSSRERPSPTFEGSIRSFVSFLNCKNSITYYYQYVNYYLRKIKYYTNFYPTLPVRNQPCRRERTQY